jgi:hypothetical protein
MFGRSTTKPLFEFNVEPLLNMLNTLGTFLTNTKGFMESVKVIYKQNGFVASGLTAQIRVAPRPINFAIGA